MKWSSRGRAAGWLVLVLVCALSVAAAETERPAGAKHLGRTTFLQYCGACHGRDGRGHGPAAPALNTPPADLTRIARRHGGMFPEAEVTAHINGQTAVRAHGSREMPIWGYRFSENFGGGSVGEEFARGHLYLLVEYLRSIQE